MAAPDSMPTWLTAALSEVAAAPLPVTGRVSSAGGALITAVGLSAPIGAQCWIRDSAGDFRLRAEVVGVRRGELLLTPLGPVAGVAADMWVELAAAAPSLRAGPHLLGRVIDAFGAPLDGKPLAEGQSVPLHAPPVNPMARPLIDAPLATGVRAIDTFLTFGRGQRLGIFAGPGAGKSTLLGMIARGARADCNVIALVGERGREVREFIHDQLGEAGLARSVVVVATSDRPPQERCRALIAAHAIAEQLRDGGRHVLLLADSVTRFARALRDVGLAAGEPAVRRGFTPSVFNALPALFERAGPAPEGVISAVYTVLQEDEQLADDPIAEEVRSLLDGHLVLDPARAGAGRFPAIDILASVSRVMPRVVSAEHLAAARALRGMIAKRAELDLALKLGEYKRGSDREADLAIELAPRIEALLRQPADQLTPFAEALRTLRSLAAPCLPT